MAALAPISKRAPAAPVTAVREKEACVFPLARTMAPSPDIVNDELGVFGVPEFCTREPASSSTVPRETSETSGAERGVCELSRVRDCVLAVSAADPSEFAFLVPPIRRLSAPHELRVATLNATEPEGAEGLPTP